MQQQRSTRRFRRLALLGSFVVACTIGTMLAGSGTAVAKVADGVPCPPAPSGWTASSLNPDVFGPVQDPGIDTIRVSCGYLNGDKLSTVTVMYALPRDPNPFNDFNFGCGSVSTAWTSAQRTYLVTSAKEWAFAEFIDPYKQIDDSSVPVFEQLARTLLGNAAGVGHACKTVEAPTDTIAGYRFSFELSVTRKDFAAVGGVPMGTPGGDAYGGAVLAKVPRGEFETKGQQTKNGLVKVVSFNIPNIAMSVLDKGKHHTVTLKVERGVYFKVSDPREKLKLAVQVVGSSDASCPKGSKGTISVGKAQQYATVTGAGTVSIDVCGGFFHGSSHVQVTLQDA